MKDLEQQLPADAKPEKPQCAPHKTRENMFNAQRRQAVMGPTLCVRAAQINDQAKTQQTPRPALAIDDRAMEDLQHASVRLQQLSARARHIDAMVLEQPVHFRDDMARLAG